MAEVDDEIRIKFVPEDRQKPADVNAEMVKVDREQGNRLHGREKAGQLLQEAGHWAVIAPEDNKRIWKIDLGVLPIILVTYWLQSLDMAAIYYASVFGLIKDRDLQGEQCSWLGAVVYVAQLVWQPVVAYCLVKVP